MWNSSFLSSSIYLVQMFFLLIFLTYSTFPMNKIHQSPPETPFRTSRVDPKRNARHAVRLCFLFCFAGGDPNEGRVVRMERSSRLALRFAARRQQQNSPQRWSRARLRLPFEAGCCDCTLPRRPLTYLVRTTRIYGKRWTIHVCFSSQPSRRAHHLPRRSARKRRWLHTNRKCAGRHTDWCGITYPHIHVRWCRQFQTDPQYNLQGLLPTPTPVTTMTTINQNEVFYFFH